MVRGPLAKGILSGNYSAGTVFTDSVRSGWHKNEKSQADFEFRIAQVDKLKQILKPGQEMVQAALGYVISHPAVSAVIPGARSPDQATTNALAGAVKLSPAESKKLVAVLDK